MVNQRQRYILAAIVLLLRHRRRRRNREESERVRNAWVRQIFAKREQLGEFHTLVQEMRTTDRESFFRYLRMSPERYFQLLEMVEPLIRRRDTNFRKAISADERLTLTLRYLASGSMQESLSFSFRTLCMKFVWHFGIS